MTGTNNFCQDPPPNRCRECLEPCMQITTILLNQDCKSELYIPAETRILLHIKGKHNTLFISTYATALTLRQMAKNFISPCWFGIQI